MVFNVRCFKCGEREVRLVLGGRAIIHARCHACESNLLAEVMEFEQEIAASFSAKDENKPGPDDTATSLRPPPPETLEEESGVPASNA